MLIFPLKKEWYEKIRSGEKRIEYRKVKPYWYIRIRRELEKELDKYALHRFDMLFFALDISIKCVLRLGYTKRQMTADITKIGVVDGKDTDLRVDKPVYAIYLANVREN